MREDTAIRVVGGSVAGLTTALSLIRSGFHNIEVLEAMPDSARTQGGGTLDVTKGTVSGLQSLGIDPSEYLSPLRRPPVGDIHEWQHVGTTSWYEIHHALRARLPGGVLRSGMRLTSHSPIGNGRSVLGFTSGAREESELTIVADGRNSRGRRLVGDHRKLQYGEFAILRGQALPPTPNLVDHSVNRTAHSTQFVCRPFTRRTQVLPPGHVAFLDWSFSVNLSARKFEEVAGEHPTVKTFVPPHQISSEARAFMFDQAEQLPADLKSIVHGSHLLQISPALDLVPPSTMMFGDPDGAPALLVGDALIPQRPQAAQGMNLAVSEAMWFGHLAACQGRGEFSEAELFRRMNEMFIPTVTAFQAKGVASCQQLGLGVPPKIVIPDPRTKGSPVTASLSGFVRPLRPGAQNTRRSK